jgi:hypothetical protein
VACTTLVCMTVKAWLNEQLGNDLERVAQHFATGDPMVGSDAGDYYLTSRSFDDLWVHGGLDIAALWLLTQINAAERLLDPQLRPISLSCRFSDDSGRGPRQLGGKIDFWSLLDRRDLQPRSTREPLSGAPTFVRRAAEHRDVAEVLIILGRGDWISWHDLYKIFEIVRDNVGSHKALIAKGWKSKEDISAFTEGYSAGRVEVQADYG